MGQGDSKFRREFQALQVIGSGDFGLVIKAKNKFDSSESAIKLVVVESRKKEPNKEVRTLARIPPHENLVTYRSSWIEKWGKAEFKKIMKGANLDAKNKKKAERLGLISNASILCIQMELCLSDLAVKLEQDNGPVNGCVQWHYLGQIAKALEHLHKYKIIHRDLKPANIFYTSEGRIKVGDLGIAKTLGIDNAGREYFTAIGTPVYMPPEQHTKKYGKSVDIYALGIILGELFYHDRMKKEGERLFFISTLRSGSFPEKLKEDWPAVTFLISKMVQNKPEKRISLETLLKCYQLLKNVIGTQKHGFRCDTCLEKGKLTEIKGRRFQCMDCSGLDSFDLCEDCKLSKISHPGGHKLEERTSQDSHLSKIKSFFE